MKTEKFSKQIFELTQSLKQENQKIIEKKRQEEQEKNKEEQRKKEKTLALQKKNEKVKDIENTYIMETMKAHVGRAIKNYLKENFQKIFNEKNEIKFFSTQIETDFKLILNKNLFQGYDFNDMQENIKKYFTEKNIDSNNINIYPKLIKLSRANEEMDLITFFLKLKGLLQNKIVAHVELRVTINQNFLKNIIAEGKESTEYDILKKEGDKNKITYKAKTL